VKAKGYPDFMSELNPVRLLPLLKPLLPFVGDALPHHNMPHFDQPEVHDIYRKWRRLIDESATPFFIICSAPFYTCPHDFTSCLIVYKP
jgi:hypothetical protein